MFISLCLCVGACDIQGYVHVFDMEGHWRDQSRMRDAGEENVPSAGLDYVSFTLMEPSAATTTSRLPACMHHQERLSYVRLLDLIS